MNSRSDTTPKPMPDFKRPPVIEVVCGIQFVEQAELHAARLGAFWQLIREEYPVVEEHSPLAAFTEPADVSPERSPQVEMVTVPPLPRLFLVSRTPNWLIQVQKNRFFHNWRTVQEGDEYPRFAAVFDRFWTAWTKFCGFVRDEGLSALDVKQLEVTYINHIPAGTAWVSYDNIGDVFPDLSWRTKREFLSTPEFINWHAGFALPERSGRLHVSLKHGIRKKDSHPVLLCELTTRGMSRSANPDDLKSWFQAAREWIVRGFTDLTGNKAHQVWGRLA